MSRDDPDGGTPPSPSPLAKLLRFCEMSDFYFQIRLNKGVIYQIRLNKGLNSKKKRFYPVFAGKFVHLLELRLLKS